MKKLLLLLGWACVASTSYGQGAINIQNSVLTRMQLLDPATGTTVPVPTSVALYYGVFANGLGPIQPLATSSTTTAGIIDAPFMYPILGAPSGQSVPLQIRAWSAAFGQDWQAARASGAYYGETDVRDITPGAPAGPPTTVWQPRTGTDPHRFYPIIVSGVAPQAGDLSIDDLTVAEGSNGVVNAVFTIRLTGTVSQPITVDFATQDGTALAGQDYVATNGTLTFAPGETSHSVTVTVTADTPAEPDESFTVVLSNPSQGGVIRRGTGTGVITEARIMDVRIDTAVVFHTLAGRHYVVERSTDLTTWSALPNATDVVGVGGAMTVYDQGVGCSGVRYYRTRLLSP
jgi:hypothetical protein